MRSSTKSTIFVISICLFGVGLILTGAQAAQSRSSLTQPIVATTSHTPAPDAITLTTTFTTTPTATVTPTATATATHTPPPIEIIIEDPDIFPVYGELCVSYWYSYTNVRGHYAYLTLNVDNPNISTNSGEWRPSITKPGYYRLEAFIPSHPPISWECPEKTISQDTSDASYIIHHANGQTSIAGAQQLYKDDWLPLGEYLFRAGSDGYVTLTDLNNEASFTSTVSFSSMRFTWQRLPPESLFLPLVSKIASPVITGTVSIQNAPAFDQCHLATTAQMQTWWNFSPYRITNVYIGGGLLYHECTVPDANWINTVRNQGWGMIPTWVGPQAPCSDYRLRMSSDPLVAYQQGQAEADAASLVASQIGLASEGLGGTIIYYDMEGYSPANSACRDAVNSFLSGWTQRLHSLDNHAGAYGGSCTSYVKDWAAAPFAPENVWVAAWYQNPDDIPDDPMDVPLFGLTCLPDDLWPNHQRIRQYRASHNETWGHVTFNIDSNLVDAEVVTPLHPPSELISDISYVNNTTQIFDYISSLNALERSWLVSGNVLYTDTYRENTWQQAANIPSGMAIRKISFLNENLGWAIASFSDGTYSLLYTPDGGLSWLMIASLPINAGWEPSSLQFTTPVNGWIVIKKSTPANFSMGRLLHTTDGGNSWHASDLPIGEAVRFITDDIGWIAGGVDGSEIYHTIDGGLTWFPVPLHLPQGLSIHISLPAFGDLQNGILPIIVNGLNTTELIIFSTHDGGATWQPTGTISNIPEGLLIVNFSTPQIGWGTTDIGICQTENNIKECSLQSILWSTNDRGKTWEAIRIPQP